jgi:hypothetical protein
VTITKVGQDLVGAGADYKDRARELCRAGPRQSDEIRVRSLLGLGTLAIGRTL